MNPSSRRSDYYYQEILLDNIQHEKLQLFLANLTAADIGFINSPKYQDWYYPVIKHILFKASAFIEYIDKCQVIYKMFINCNSLYYVMRNAFPPRVSQLL